MSLIILMNRNSMYLPFKWVINSLKNDFRDIMVSPLSVDAIVNKQINTISSLPSTI